MMDKLMKMLLTVLITVVCGLMLSLIFFIARDSYYYKITYGGQDNLISMNVNEIKDVRIVTPSFFAFSNNRWRVISSNDGIKIVKVENDTFRIKAYKDGHYKITISNDDDLYFYEVMIQVSPLSHFKLKK